MKRVLILAIILSALNVTAQTISAPEDMQVMMKMSELKNSLITKDSVTLSKLLAEDVTYGHTNGMIQSKAQLIRDVLSGVQDYKSIDPSDMNIRVFDHTAIVNMKSAVKMIFNNNPLEFNMYVTLVWIKKDSDWKLEARQSVKL
jgi:hypothetical protein